MDIDTRPLCHCHGEPMSRNGHFKGKQRWMCAERRRQRSRDDYYRGGHREVKAARYADRRARGVCVRCEGPLLSEAQCWDCLNELEARYAVRI